MIAIPDFAGLEVDFNHFLVRFTVSSVFDERYTACRRDLKALLLTRIVTRRTEHDRTAGRFLYFTVRVRIDR